LKELVLRRWRQHKEDKICFKFLKDTKKILDVGCGTGRFMLWFKRDQIIGIDENDFSIEICKKMRLNALKMDALNFNFNEKFDAIYCSHLVEHFYPNQLYRFLKGVDELLIERGLLIIRTLLLWDGFYDDLSRVRSYNPSVFIRYLCYPNTQQKTRSTISSKYKPIKVIYRYMPLIYIKSPKNKVEMVPRFTFDFLAHLGTHSFKKIPILLF